MNARNKGKAKPASGIQDSSRKGPDLQAKARQMLKAAPQSSALQSRTTGRVGQQAQPKRALPSSVPRLPFRRAQPRANQLLQDRQRPHTSPRLGHSDIQQQCVTTDPSGLSAVGRRTSSFKQPVASKLGLQPAASVAAAASAAAAGPGTPGDLEELGTRLRDAASGAVDVAKLSSALILIAAALQQCGQQLADGQVTTTSAPFLHERVPNTALADDQLLQQEVTKLQQQNAALQERALQWESEREKLHDCIDQFRRHMSRTSQGAVAPLAKVGLRDTAAHLQAATPVDVTSGMDTERSVASDGCGDAWPLPQKHQPAKLRPTGVPAINLASLQQG